MVCTWAHQGFAGVNHLVNDADQLRSNNYAFDTSTLHKLASYFIGEAYPLGHGAVLTYPDQPYLIWEYTNGLGERIRRDNPKDYMQAVDHMFHVLSAYRQGNGNISFEKRDAMPVEDREQIKHLLVNLVDEDGNKRHQAWLKEIAVGSFSFGKEELAYRPSEKRWKIQALRPVDKGRPRLIAYSDRFLQSNWKLFHDALMAHRFTVIREILPAYHICAV